MHARSMKRHLATAVAVALLATPALAAKITVGQNGIDTIQAAVDAANAGDVIVVPAGTWNEGVDIFGKTNLKIIGKKGATIRSGGEDYGFEVASSAGITIEGFIIDATGERGGVSIDESNDITVSKCEIDGGVAPGVDISAADDCTVTGCTITNVEDDAIHLRYTQGTMIVKNEIADCERDGIDAGTDGGESDPNDGLVVQKNSIMDVGGRGIWFSGADPDVSRNDIDGTGDEALYNEANDDVTGGIVMKNTVANNDGEALDHAGNGTTISKNTMTEPGGVCEQVRIRGDMNLVEKNRVGGSPCYAVYVTGNQNEISKNGLSANGSSVLFLAGEGQVAVKNKIDGRNGADGVGLSGAGSHTLEKTKIVGAAGDGVVLNSDNNTLTKNVIGVCRGDGIVVWSVGNALTGNKVLNNEGNGVKLSSGTVDNVFKKNKFLRNNTSGNEDTFDVHDDAPQGQNTIDDSNKFGSRSEPVIGV